MRTLNRYLGREIASASLFVLLVLTAIFSLFDLINQLGELGRANYQFSHAFLFVLLLVPSHAYELMPIAALIGTIYALSKLAADSEFTIMRVSGMTTRDLALSVMRVGLLLVAIAYVLGEGIAPAAENLAQRYKSMVTGSTIGREFRSGVWVRDLVRSPDGQSDRLRFVNVARVNPDGSVEDWRIFEFDPQLHLRSISTAHLGTFRPDGGWTLTDVVDTQLPVVDTSGQNPAAQEAYHQAGSVSQRFDTRFWVSDLTPAIFGVLLVQPERQSAYSLFRYIRHLAQNHQRTDRYEIALWKKFVYPLVCSVMMALALPFAYLHVRAGSVSIKIFAGIMIGVLFYAINKLFSNVGMINTWPPPLVASAPALFALACAGFALYWVERR